MQNTPNLNLKKLEDSDTADMKHFNANWDTLDGHSVNFTAHACFATNTSDTDDYTIAVAGFSDYTAGQIVSFKATVANIGACTLSVNGKAARAIKKNVSADLETNDIVVGQVVTVIDDGTNYQLLSIPRNVTTAAGTQTLTNKTLTAPKITASSYIADANGNELIKAPNPIANAVNEITVSNAVTGSGPKLEATGGDTNIDLLLGGKGTGKVKLWDGAAYVDPLTYA